MEHHAYALREIAASAGLPTVQHMAKQPGVQGVYRMTVRYNAGRAHHSAATIVRSQVDRISLEVVYERLFGHKPLVYPVSLKQYEAFAAALHTAGFDRMSDQRDVPFFGVDLWLVERAAGSFVKSVIIAPRTAVNPHIAVVKAIEYYLPEAVRAVG